MNITDTTKENGQREASRMLARVMGLAPQLFSDVCNFYHEDTYDIFVSIYPHGWYHGMTKDEAWKYFPNLYDPANMALAWRVLNWVGQTRLFDDVATWADARMAITQAVVNGQDLPPAEAQRAWLDKILQLAIEAGMLP